MKTLVLLLLLSLVVDVAFGDHADEARYEEDEGTEDLFILVQFFKATKSFFSYL